MSRSSVGAGARTPRTRRLRDLAGPGREPLLELLGALRGDSDGIDAHDAHVHRSTSEPRHAEARLGSVLPRCRPPLRPWRRRGRSNRRRARRDRRRRDPDLAGHRRRRDPAAMAAAPPGRRRLSGPARGPPCPGPSPPRRSVHRRPRRYCSRRNRSISAASASPVTSSALWSSIASHEVGDVGTVGQALLHLLGVRRRSRRRDRRGRRWTPASSPHALEQRADRGRRRVARHVVRHLRPEPDRGDAGLAERDLEHGLHAGRARVVGADRADLLGERVARRGREHGDRSAVRRRPRACRRA